MHTRIDTKKKSQENISLLHMFTQSAIRINHKLQCVGVYTAKPGTICSTRSIELMPCCLDAALGEVLARPKQVADFHCRQRHPPLFHSFKRISDQLR